MFFLPEILISLISLASATASVVGVPEKRQDVSIQTTFYYDQSCNATELKMLRQAHKDALVLANAALVDREILNTTHTLEAYINFRTHAAIDYWGPFSKSAPHQEKIFNTLDRATRTYRGSGWSDWWNDRYIWNYCRDLSSGCTDTSPAYTRTSNTKLLYPEIVYCPAFFDKLASHGTQVAKIKADKSGFMKQNLRNLRSQATTVLHEWLHIGGFSAEVCVGGCADTIQLIGGDKKENVRTYKAGRAKLLANRDPENAANTNDNYAYFAMACFMEKTFGTYPEYPTRWDASKTRAENEKIEDGQPGAPSTVQSWELDDSGPLAGIASVVSALPLAATEYPSWYQPVVDAGATTSLPSISPPAETSPPLAGPDIDSVVCDISGGSPLIYDCYHAFGKLNLSPDSSVLQKKKGSVWWSSVSFPPRACARSPFQRKY